MITLRVLSWLTTMTMMILFTSPHDALMTSHTFDMDHLYYMCLVSSYRLCFEFGHEKTTLGSNQNLKVSNTRLCGKIRTFYFGRYIFGHFLCHFKQLKDSNFGDFAETLAKINLSLHVKNTNYTERISVEMIVLPHS